MRKERKETTKSGSNEEITDNIRMTSKDLKEDTKEKYKKPKGRSM